MFAALVVVWAPSSIHCVYRINNPEKPCFGLTLASALGLPLQGFWNAVVWVVTSWGEYKGAWKPFMGEYQGKGWDREGEEVRFGLEEVKHVGDWEDGEWEFEDGGNGGFRG